MVFWFDAAPAKHWTMDMFIKKRSGIFFAVIIGFAMNRLTNIHLDTHIFLPHPPEYWDFRHAMESRRARLSGSVVSVFGEDPVAYGIIRKCL